MKKKHIWVFYQDGGTPAQGWGDRHYFLATHYDPEKYYTTIFSANDCHMFSERVDFPGNYWLTKYESINYCWIKVNSYRKGRSKRRVLSWFLFAFKLFFVPRKRIGKPDIIVVSSMPMFPVIPAFFYKLIWGVKVIFEVRDIWPLTIIDMENYQNSHPFVVLLRFIEKLAYRNSDHLVSVLDKAKQHFSRAINKEVRFTWISNGIDPQILQTNSSLDIDILQSLPKNKFIVGYAGKMSVSNALEFIIDAAALLSENEGIHFVLVGEGDKKEELIQRSKNLRNVTFLPRIKKHLVHQLITHFDAAIISFRKLSIYQYGVSTNKLFDYMMAELPIIMASETVHEVYHNSGAILHTEAENPQAIAKTIAEVSNMPKSELKDLGAKGKTYVSRNFIYKHLASRYEKVFEGMQTYHHDL